MRMRTWRPNHSLLVLLLCSKHTVSLSYVLLRLATVSIGIAVILGRRQCKTRQQGAECAADERVSHANRSHAYCCHDLHCPTASVCSRVRSLNRQLPWSVICRVRGNHARTEGVKRQTRDDGIRRLPDSSKTQAFPVTWLLQPRFMECIPKRAHSLDVQHGMSYI